MRKKKQLVFSNNIDKVIEEYLEVDLKRLIEEYKNDIKVLGKDLGVISVYYKVTERDALYLYNTTDSFRIELSKLFNKVCKKYNIDHKEFSINIKLKNKMSNNLSREEHYKVVSEEISKVIITLKDIFYKKEPFIDDNKKELINNVLDDAINIKLDKVDQSVKYDSMETLLSYIGSILSKGLKDEEEGFKVGNYKGPNISYYNYTIKPSHILSQYPGRNDKNIGVYAGTIYVDNAPIYFYKVLGAENIINYIKEHKKNLINPYINIEVNFFKTLKEMEDSLLRNISAWLLYTDRLNSSLINR